MKVKAILSFAILTFTLNVPLAAAAAVNKDYHRGFQSGTETALSNGELEGLSAGNSIAKTSCQLPAPSAKKARAAACRKEMRTRLEANNQSLKSSHSTLPVKFVKGFRNAFNYMFSEIFIQKCVETASLHELGCVNSPAAEEGLLLGAANPQGVEHSDAGVSHPHAAAVPAPAHGHAADGGSL